MTADHSLWTTIFKASVLDKLSGNVDKEIVCVAFQLRKVLSG